MRILAVDDDPVILGLLQGCLAADHDLHCCTSAEEALRMVKDEAPFDCFLLDVILPGVDGIDLCKMLREMQDHRTTPILMITASRAPDLMGRAFVAGATDFICKPLEGIELGARINTAQMLNDSLCRERMAQHQLSDLAQRTKVRFDEAVALDVEGMTDLSAVEIELLRMPAGVYAMTLFQIEVHGLQTIHETGSGFSFRRHLEQVGSAVQSAAEAVQARVAYVGNGRFLGVVMTRSRLDHVSMMIAMNGALQRLWDGAGRDRLEVPVLEYALLSDQKLWSGLSASDTLRRYSRCRDGSRDCVVEAGEERLFARFRKKANVEGD